MDKAIALIRVYLTKISETLLVQFNGGKPVEAILKEQLSLMNEIVTRIHFCVERRIRAATVVSLQTANKRVLYGKLKPVFDDLLQIAELFPRSGFISSGSAHYLIRALKLLLEVAAPDVLEMIRKITSFAVQAGYAYEQSAIQEMVGFTEKLLADHRDLLLKEENLDNLVEILNIFIYSGWVDALKLLWKLDDNFK